MTKRPLGLPQVAARVMPSWGWRMKAIGQVLFTEIGRQRRSMFLVFSPQRGQNKSAQGTASRRQPQSDALGTVAKQPGSPERAKQGTPSSPLPLAGEVAV